MNDLLGRVLLAPVLVALAASVGRADEAVTLSGRVVDRNGSALAGIDIVFESDAEVRHVTSDAKGRFVLLGVAPATHVYLSALSVRTQTTCSLGVLDPGTTAHVEVALASLEGADACRVHDTATADRYTSH